MRGENSPNAKGRARIAKLVAPRFSPYVQINGVTFQVRTGDLPRVVRQPADKLSTDSAADTR
jgi:hypothetical protein